MNILQHTYKYCDIWKWKISQEKEWVSWEGVKDSKRIENEKKINKNKKKGEESQGGKWRGGDTVKMKMSEQ